MWPFRRHAAYDVRSSRPWWLTRDGTGDARPTLPGDVEADIAIIGAGISGALIADALLATGARIVMLDAHEPGQGSTAASTALLQYEIDTHLVDLARMIGGSGAAQAYQACVRSLEMLEERFPDLLAQSGYERRESLYLAADEAAVAPLKMELAARRAIHIHCQWLGADELRQRYGCHRPGALLSTPAATIDPLRFTRGLLAGCQRHGLQVFSRAKVEAIEEAGALRRLRVRGGRSVMAKYVVVAAGYASLDFVPLEVANVDNTFALVTEPLPDARRAALPLVWESARPYLYLRGTQDGRLIMGGADVPFRSATAREALLGRQVRKVADAYEKLFEETMPPVAFAWAGSFATTRDGLPYIGSVPRHDPQVFHALCLGGNGITYAIHAGEIVRAGIEGRVHELDGVFGFARVAGSGSADQATIRAGRQSG